MDSVSNKILKPILFLFILGVIASLYFLYDLPYALESSSSLISPEAAKQASPTLIKLSAVIIVTLIFGIAHAIISTQKKNKKEVIEKVVYIDKNKNDDISAKEENESVELDSNKIDDIINTVKSKKSIQTKYDAVISGLCNKLEASHGILYTSQKSGTKQSINMVSSFAFSSPDNSEISYEFGEGLVGQVAKEMKTMRVNEVPEDYIPISSGLGNAMPKYLLFHPIVINKKVEAVVELASFKEFTKNDEKIINEVIEFANNNLKDIADNKAKPAKSKTKK